MFVAGAIDLNDGIVKRGDGTAFSGDLGGDALIDFRRQARFDQDGQFGLAEHVDEAGRDDFAGSVDGAFAGRGSQVTDGGNFSVADADFAGIPGRTGAVDDVAVGDDEVEGGWRLRGQGVGCGEEQNHHDYEIRGMKLHRFSLFYETGCARRLEIAPRRIQIPNASHSYTVKWPGIDGTSFINIIAMATSNPKPATDRSTGDRIE
jgi:hypothetical protein